MFDTSDIQTSIFQGSDRQLEFAELCAALFEATLTELAKQPNLDTDRIQRKLAGLSHHVKNAAFKLLTVDTPLKVDIYNASWQNKQAAKCPAKDYLSQEACDWYNKFACYGLPVPVLIKDFEQSYIELDSIDQIDLAAGKVHLNKNKWVELHCNDEMPLAITNKQDQLVVLQKPGKAMMSSASCGHRWNHKGTTHPRKLPLRELLLSTTINWKNYRFPI